MLFTHSQVELEHSVLQRLHKRYWRIWLNKRGKIEKSVLLFYVLKRHFDTKQKKEIEKSEKISIIKRENSDFLWKTWKQKTNMNIKISESARKDCRLKVAESACSKCFAITRNKKIYQIMMNKMTKILLTAFFMFLLIIWVIKLDLLFFRIITIISVIALILVLVYIE